MSENNDLVKKPLPLDMDKWRPIIMDWESSKESQKSYCERLGINLNTFTYARSKLTPVKKQKLTLVPIEINQPDSQKQFDINKVIIENPQGYKLHVSSDLSLERLTKIFKLSG